MKLSRVSEESQTITFIPKEVELRFTPDGRMVATLWDAENENSYASLVIDVATEDQDAEDLQRIADNRIPLMLTGKMRETRLMTKDGTVTAKRFDATAWHEIPF